MGRKRLNFYLVICIEKETSCTRVLTGTVGVLYVDGVNVNLLLVEKGFAWHYKRYSQDSALANAEINARRARVGLWKEGNAVAPWEWRKR